MYSFYLTWRVGFFLLEITLCFQIFAYTISSSPSWRSWEETRVEPSGGIGMIIVGPDNVPLTERIRSFLPYKEDQAAKEITTSIQGIGYFKEKCTENTIYCTKHNFYGKCSRISNDLTIERSYN